MRFTFHIIQILSDVFAIIVLFVIIAKNLAKAVLIRKVFFLPSCWIYFALVWKRYLGIFGVVYCVFLLKLLCFFLFDKYLWICFTGNQAR